MKTPNPIARRSALLAALMFAVGALSAEAQVPVDEDGNVLGDYAGTGPEVALGDDGVPLRTRGELEDLVGPVALYPDDLLAIVLPAATYPLQVVEAARFLDDLAADPSLEPDSDWDDSVVALVNYPEIVEMMNKDLDWTWKLGEAVVAQQPDVIAAIAAFREKAQAAGNLKSDEYQTVTRNDDVIEIAPISEEVIYVPYYEPEQVVVYQPRPVYYYYPRAYPVYYYPYPAGYAFSWGYFWGVTTAFTIGWNSHCLNVYHPSFYGHPYYGYSYWDSWWYRRPSITVYNNSYYDQRRVHNRYTQGDQWRPHGYTRLRHDDQRITRNRYYPNPSTAHSGGAAQGRSLPGADRGVGRSGPDERMRQSGAGTRPRTTGNSVQDMRMALNESRAGTASNGPGNTAASSRDSRQPGANGAGTVTRSGNRYSTSVTEMRDALAASRETRRTGADRGATASRPSVPQSRSTLPQPRPATPAARPGVPTQRPAPAPRSDSRPAPPRSAAPVMRQPAPAPAVRAPSSSGSASSRPAPAPQRSSSTSSRPAPKSAPAHQSTSRPSSRRESRTR